MKSRYESRYVHLPEVTEHEVGRPRRRLSNPIVAGELEYLVQPVFDFYAVAVATALTKQILFTGAIGSSYTPAGGVAFVKSAYNTNLVQNGMLDAPKKLLVKAVALVLRSDVHPSDANRFLGDTLIDFQVASKSYWQALASKCPAGGGAFASIAYGTSTTATATTISTGRGGVSNGWPSAENVASLTDAMPQVPGLPPMQPILGVLIEQQQNFFVVVDPTIAGVQGTYSTVAAAPANDFAGTGINAHVYLEGLLLRAVL